MYYFYSLRAERVFPGFDAEPGHPRTYNDIRDMIIEHAADRQVFMKDMAYYVTDDLPQDRAFLAAMTHAFLVRDPAEAILSYHKLDPEFARTELGIEAQYRLYQDLVQAGQTPLVITAMQLRQNPEETLGRYWQHIGLPYAANAFSWDGAVPEGWKSVVSWHRDVLRHGAIRPPDKERDVAAELATLGSRFIDYDRHHRPFYEALCEVAEAQLHQK